MSPGSNGGIAPEAVGMPGPIPAGAILHCVALMDEAEGRLSRFVDALPDRLLGHPDLQLSSWTALDAPRPCSWCDLEGGGWSFRLVFDPQGLAASAVPAVVAGAVSPECQDALDEHHACCLIFLMAAPLDSVPWSRFGLMMQVAWGWVDAGATLLALPEAQLLLPRRILMGIEPATLTPEHGYMFLSNGLAHVEEKKGDGDRKLWLRTWGLGQFWLPDLAVSLPSRLGEEEALEADLESLRLLFETLPPAMIKEGGVLPVGGTVQVGARTWTAVGESAVDYPFLRSRCGVQLFV